MDHLASVVELITGPAFAAQNGTLLCYNRSAAGLVPEPGESILPLLLTGREDYEALTSDVLVLTMDLGGTPAGVTVTAMDGWQLFRFEQDPLPAELQAMGLVCADLRLPLSNLAMMASRIVKDHPSEDAGQLNRSVSQALRILNNVSNAGRFCADRSDKLVDRDIVAVTAEILEECASLLAEAGITLQHSLPAQPVIMGLDAEAYRQAIYNLLDNAAMAAPDSTVEVTLSRKGNRVLLTVTDQGPGIAEAEKPLLFQSYKRQPSLDPASCRSGLGLAVVRYAATIQGGTALVSSPRGGPTRICLSLPCRKGTQLTMQASGSITVPATDNAKVMLSNVLPARLYERK